MHREVEFECSSYLDKEYDIVMVIESLIITFMIIIIIIIIIGKGCCKSNDIK